jgi:Polysaccharide pyruvyl transferase
MIRELNYVGWLGHENLGDEAIFEATKKLLAPYVLQPYNSYNFLSPTGGKNFPVFDGVGFHVSIFGGGTLLPDDITWVKPAKYNYLFGAAVKDPNFSSKFSNFDDVTIARLRSFDFRLVGVRDEFSKGMLSGWGIRSEVIGDPALSIEPSPNILRKSSRIAVNVGCDGELWGGDQKRVVQELTRACSVLKDRGFELVAVPFSEQDVPYAKLLSIKSGIPIFDEWRNLRSTVDLIATCGIMIGQRLHSQVISAATFTPFVSLEYRPKCRAFAESLGYSRFSIRTDALNAKEILMKVDDLVADWKSVQSGLSQKVFFFRTKQQSFSKHLISDLLWLPGKAWYVSKSREIVKKTLFWDTDVIMRKNLAHFWKQYNKFLFLRLMRRFI